MGRDLVSRPTATLAPDEVVSAAIESTAENLVDSIAAPVLAYAVGGLPAAWTYRAVNTADAMWGYRDARYERFGKAAARLDDLANLVPARVGAVALAAGAALAGEDGAGAARVAWTQHRRTASPNAGWPMAAMAGALDVGLAKRGAYRLGDGELPSSPDAIRRARRVLGGGRARHRPAGRGRGAPREGLQVTSRGVDTRIRGGESVMRNLGPAVALSILAHGGAVATVGTLGALWLAGAPSTPTARSLRGPGRAGPRDERSDRAGRPSRASRRVGPDPVGRRDTDPRRVAARADRRLQAAGRSRTQGEGVELRVRRAGWRS